MLGYIRKASRTYTDVCQGHPLSFAAFKQMPWHHYGLLALEETQLSLRTPFLDNDFVRTAFRAPGSSEGGHDVCRQLIADGNPALTAIPTDRGSAGGHPWAAAGRAWIEFLRKTEYAHDVGMPQWYVRVHGVLNRFHLERLFLGRQKFAHFRLWYSHPLSRYVKDILLDGQTLSRPYLDRGRVEAIVADHIHGRRNYTSDIHKLLTLELVHRLFVDSRPAHRDD
jgi:asparagine synthase (glutamine-hydrolysing)